MPIHRVKVTNTHDFTVKELAKLTAKAQNPYTRQVLSAVAMTANGIPV